MVALPQWVTPAANYGVPGEAVPAALPPAVTPVALSQENNPVKGTTAPGPGGDYPQQSIPVAGASVPGAGSAENDPEFNTSTEGTEYSNPGFDQGPWPVSCKPGEAMGTVPEDGIDTYAYAIAAKNHRGLIGAWERNQDHPGSELHSQSTDEAGWQQNTPSGRTGRRRLVGQSYAGVDNYWPPTAARPVPRRTAQTATPINGHLANFGGNFNGGGNLQYETPATPETTTLNSVGGGSTNTQTPAQPNSSGLNQWGDFSG